MTVSEDLLAQFQALGMSEEKAKETLKNANVTNNLQKALYECRGVELLDGVGMLLYHMASKIKPQIIEHLPLLVKYILTQKLDNTLRVEKALEYFLIHGCKKDSVNTAELEKECGVGIVITPEEIDKTVEEEIKKNKNVIMEQRYRFNVGKIMQEVRNKLKWADGKAIKNEVEVQIFDLLGPKTDEDLKPAPKLEKKKEKTPKTQEKSEKLKEKDQSVDGANTIAELMKTKVHFHAPGENYKTDGYVITPNTEQLLKEHIITTCGKVRTRFPPEPNGILHIGHAKAININFGYAAAQNGVCFLRYDDTNPEKEEEKFFVGIKNMVEWLGYEPYKITHSSDYFQQLYEWAVVLIKKGLAYVCHQTSEDIKGFNPPPSPWRERPIDESVQLFEDMKNGKIDEGKATLRMKVTLEEGKMDPVAYRIKFIPHHRTKDTWCIYPTYDYTHCLCDSIENITHSLCTKEFQSRRSSYYWLCNALDIYCPVQWEYGRLNMNYTVVSKRKIAKLISERIVKNWDDPRLFTLTALKRRGFPTEAINNFCAQMGITGAQVTVDPQMLESCVRDVLNLTAPRILAVLEPLKISIRNFPSNMPIEIDVPHFPQNPEKGSRKIIFDREIYIDRSDFKMVGETGYRRLTPNQSVGLRHTGFVITVVAVEHEEQSKEIKEIMCICEEASKVDKPKAFIQWVSKPMQVEVRLYESLFMHPNPEDPKLGGFLNDINKNSLQVLKSYVDASLKDVKVYDKFQFERCGYFSVDPDTNKDRIIFNRTVSLKEDAGKI